MMILGRGESSLYMRVQGGPAQVAENEGCGGLVRSLDELHGNTEPGVGQRDRPSVQKPLIAKYLLR